MVEALYSEFSQELYRYTRALTQNEAAAQDLLQEVFLRALSHLEDLEPLGQKQRRAWLYKTARNLYYDQMRRQALFQRKMTAPDTLAADEYAAVETRLLLAYLPYDLRILFEKRYFEGYNATELGELYDLPPSTIRSKLRQCRAILRQMLSADPKKERES